MTVEITSENGLFQFKVNEHKPTELLVRHNKLSARWYVLSLHDSPALSLEALLEARRREDRVVRVTVEVIPFGVEQLARRTHELIISNDLTGDRDVGNYTVTLHTPNDKIAVARVRGHEREDGVLRLVELVLGALRSDKGGDDK